MIELELPYPPSVNHYWRMVGNRMLISRQGREFRQRVCPILMTAGVGTMLGRLAVKIEVCPPDHRRRDLDNVQKPVLDALEKGGTYQDDSQVDLLITERKEVVRNGRIEVTVEGLPLNRCPLCGERFTF